MSEAPSFLGNLTGVNFRPEEARLEARALQIGDRVDLKREPTNEYDDNAIKVLSQKTGQLLGYVEKSVAVSLSFFLDTGHIYTAEVVQLIDNKMTPALLRLVPTGDKIEVIDTRDITDF